MDILKIIEIATERVNHNDNLKVPTNFDFQDISGLSNEMIERLERAQPQTFGQIRKISGLTPAALSTVLVHLTSNKTINFVNNFKCGTCYISKLNRHSNVARSTFSIRLSL